MANEKKELSLLEKAKNVGRTQKSVSKDEIELAVAWAKDEVTLTQCQKVLSNGKGGGVYGRLALGLKQYIKNQL